VHGVSGTLFAVLAAFQFPTALRRGHRSWHRRTGRLLVPLGLVAAVSAIWLTLFYPHLHDSGPLLSVFRVTFASALAVTIWVAFIAIRRREIARHRRWMIRAYALALGAATQIFTLGFGQAIFGDNETSTALLTAAAWVVNLAIAEWVIRRRFNRRPPQAAPVVMVQQRKRQANALPAPLKGSPE
jgi:drug/metabolite transporter (DMT)-like permease